MTLVRYILRTKGNFNLGELVGRGTNHFVGRGTNHFVGTSHFVCINRSDKGEKMFWKPGFLGQKKI